MKKKGFSLLAALLAIFALAGCAETPESVPDQFSQVEGQLYLYGEKHGSQAVMDRELELWRDYYGQGMRHLFVEYPYYTAQLLNEWMAAEDDTILEEIYADWEGTLAHQESVKEFYRTIKSECPETVFHGTDVGHQYQTTGKRYLDRLKAAGLEGSPEWDRASEVAEQGRSYYSFSSDAEADSHRERCMVENFLWEYGTIEGESVMGVYGGYHIRPGTGEEIPMGERLRETFGEALHTEDLSWLANYVETATLTVGGKEYKADCFRRDMRGVVEGFDHGDYWRLKDVGEDFKDCPLGEDVLPYYNYPVEVEDGQVFRVDYTLTDGTELRLYYRADGYEWEGWPSSRQILVEE